MKILTKLSLGPPQLYRAWINELSSLCLNWVPIFQVTSLSHPWIMLFFIPVFLVLLTWCPSDASIPLFQLTDACTDHPLPLLEWGERSFKECFCYQPANFWFSYLLTGRQTFPYRASLFYLKGQRMGGGGRWKIYSRKAVRSSRYKSQSLNKLAAT